MSPVSKVPLEMHSHHKICISQLYSVKEEGSILHRPLCIPLNTQDAFRLFLSWLEW